ncbi:hypothetical protein N657DRAFT_651469 [Parathielavia appendiculata]|uniref:BZIP domain-containing protein n=1 Tax=Parathielavia appendiculata TaxID=2587402 RepID=A0AAN6TPI3_9PEZI|nr:hypothetical protein N657DRAFT_651469 [Parathielavia appendiculata]
MAGSQPNGFDPLADLVDFSEYDDSNNNNNNSNLTYQHPSLSPSSTTKLSPSLSLKTETSVESTLFPTNQGFTAPSHQYDLYKQQTGLVPGALTTTLSMNPPHSFLPEYLDFQQQNSMLLSIGEDEAFDFNTPLQVDAPSLDMDFQTTSADNIYLNSTINPTAIGGQEPDVIPMPELTGTPGRVWPGIHQQQALARAQQQQRQQQLQAQRAHAQQHANKTQKARSPQTSDSIAEQSVQQILNSMRAEPVQYTPIKSLPPVAFPKQKKPEEEMDEDEKFLASEEGKKLDSKERRQLRNKVSARAFRSRRKDYIQWLEGELTDKINDAGLLRAQNRALIEENSRLTSLTKMLLSAPEFANYLAELSSNPQKLAQFQQPTPTQQPQVPSHAAPANLNHMSLQQRSQHFQQQFNQQAKQARKDVIVPQGHQQTLYVA